MDSILVIGCADEKLVGFLKKLGYELLSPPPDAPLPDVVTKRVIDLVLLDARGEEQCAEFTQFLRQHEPTKQLPLIVLADASQGAAIKRQNLQRCEIIPVPYAIGSVVSKIATELRLRKMAGSDEESASLGEINARLRDLNARFKKEIEQARSIQRHLIPASFPDDDRYEIAVSYEPLEEVGGDWYYVESGKDGKLRVQVADVTGHGLAAAFIGTMTKLAMTAAAKDLPHELLSEMNRLMTPNLPEGTFVTMFSYVYDPETGALDYARAGHPPGLFLKRAEQRVTELKTDGFALGFFEEGTYGRGNVELAVNDVVVAFTDALTESQNRGGDNYGLQRMGRVIKSTPSDFSAADVLMHILDDFDAFREGRILKDDVTLIVLKRLR